MDKTIEKYYYDPKLGFQSAEKLYKTLKTDGYDIPLSKIKEWINKQSIHQQFKQTKIVKTYFPIVSPHDQPFELLQVDLLDISNLALSNNGIKYLLVIIDVHSRFVFVVPLKNKFADTVNEAMEEILKSTKCKFIESDAGSEFINKSFKDLLKKYNVEIIYADVGNHHTLGIADRFCRTIRGLINKYLAANETTKYIDVLPDLVYNYNNTYHKGIKGSPASYNEDKIKVINMKKQQDAKKKEVKFEVGNDVRYILNRSAFSKGTLPTWSSTVHKIIEVSPHSYKLDNDKWFQYYYLQKVSENQKPEIKPKDKTPTREQLMKENRTKRIMTREQINPSEIITSKRNIKTPKRLKDYVK